LGLRRGSLARAVAARQEAVLLDGKLMAGIIQSVFFILGALLTMLSWAIIISAVLSWLVAFDVINLRNRAVYQISTFLDRVTGPVLRPFQRIIPPLGGVDISPIIAILLIEYVFIRIILRALETAILPLLY
jgi:YggT family protein